MIAALFDLDPRFWSKVDRSGSCWLWLKAKDKDGYGKYQLNGGGRQKHVRAHRYAFYLSHGKWADGLVLHSCDNSSCVNPDHLEEGTQDRNVRDCVSRGRHRAGRRVGSEHSRARASESDVLLWWQARATGETVASIARRYGRPAVTVSHAIIGRTWRHI